MIYIYGYIYIHIIYKDYQRPWRIIKRPSALSGFGHPSFSVGVTSFGTSWEPPLINPSEHPPGPNLRLKFATHFLPTAFGDGKKPFFPAVSCIAPPQRIKESNRHRTDFLSAWIGGDYALLALWSSFWDFTVRVQLLSYGQLPILDDCLLNMLNFHIVNWLRGYKIRLIFHRLSPLIISKKWFP